ncbi:UNVERIFIED_ORG: hypothetical protein J2W85_000774 [Ensifer adhaerens]|nr:hypothetical protein [Ensifer adhaerens]
MREYQTRQIVDQIIELDTRHIAVARSLLDTMAVDDPEIARTWIDLSAEASRDGVDQLGVFILPESVHQELHSHIRYGYVVEWLGNWSVESFKLKGELAKRLKGGWNDIDDLLTAEVIRRTECRGG